MRSESEIRTLLLTVRGIGPKIADAIIAKFGDETLEILNTAPEQVADSIRGVSQRLAGNAQLQLQAELQGQSNGQVTSIVSTSAEPTSSDVRARLLEDNGSIHEQRLRAQTVFERQGQELVEEYRASGLHVGMKRRRGPNGESEIDPANIVSLRFHFAEKIPEEDMRLADDRFARRLPAEIEGIPTDVAELVFTPYETEESDPEQEAEVLQGGVQIATQSRPDAAGTLGGIVFSPEGEPYFLTNAHVASLGQTVIQPAVDSASTIGIVTASHMPGNNEVGSVDCSIIAPDTDREVSVEIKGLEQFPIFGAGALLSSDIHRTKVFKSGAKTDVTSGWVKSIDAIVKIGTATMVNQILVEGNSEIADGGDSGSLLLLEATRRDDDVAGFLVVGLVHARSEDKQLLMASHFSKVADRLNIRPTVF